jgi:hypothetical protein
MIGLLLALYPRRWRARYEEEFRSILESRPLGPFDVADVLIGALDARLTRFRFAGADAIDGGPLMMLRLGGFGAIAGGALWFAGLAAAGLTGGEDGPWGLLIALGTIGLLLALVGLSAFQAQRDPVLAWAAFVIPGVGTIVSVIGLAAMSVSPDGAPVLGSFSPWYIWIIGLAAMVIGSIIFAVATIRAAVFSRGAALALAASSAVVVILGLGLAGGGGEAPQLVLALALGSFSASWIALGIMALRRGPIRAIAPA